MKPAASLALAAAVVAALAAPAAASAPARSWSFVITIDNLDRGLATIDWTLTGFGGGELTVCGDLDGTARHVRDLALVETTAAGERLRPLAPAADDPNDSNEPNDHDDNDCWRVPAGIASNSHPLHLRYRYDLAALARGSGDPDRAWRRGEDWIFSDGAVLLRPDPLVRGAPITVEFRLPEGASATAAWTRAPGSALRFRTDADAYDGTSYVALGRLTALGEVHVPGGAVTISVFDLKRKASSDTLRAWVERAAGSVARLYRGLPGGRADVVLVPVDSERSGIFGTVRHRVLKTVVLFFGDDAPDADFAGDWVGPHELLHVGSPVVRGRIPWFVEGFATYYQDVVRARSGARTAVAMWDDLEDGCRRFGDAGGGGSLAQESRDLRRTHRYQRVYWGGACLALHVDVAVRRATSGKRGLDDLMRELYAAGEREPLTEDALVAAIDRAAGRPFVRALLDTTAPLDSANLFRDLGVRRRGDAVTLDDTAPFAALRRSIF